MRCPYCNFYSTGNRMENESRFCSERRSVVSEQDLTCEKFVPTQFFWCRNTDCWIDVNICTARQTKETEECKKCYQKQEILEVRRAMGRKPKMSVTVGSNGVSGESGVSGGQAPFPIPETISKPKILIRR